MSQETTAPSTRPSPGPPSSAAHRVVRNSTLNLATQAVNAVCNLVVVFVLARGLGKAALGDYFTVFAWTMAVQLVLEGGLGTLLTCRLAQGLERWRETVAEAAGLFVFVVLGSAAAMLTLGGAWAWFRGDPAAGFWFIPAAVACAAIQVQRFAAGVFRGFEQFGNENLARFLQGLLFAALASLLVLTKWGGLLAVLSALAASHLVAALLLLTVLHRRWRCLVIRLDRARARHWLAEGIPLGFGDVVRGLTWQLDTLLLGLLQPPAVVGIYSVAYRPLGPLNWLPRAVLAAAFPSFARLANADDPKALGRVFADSIRLLGMISLPMALAICFCAEPLIVMLAGRDYLEAVLPLRILIWVSTLSFLSIQFRFLFTAIGRQRLFARLVVAVFAIEFALEAALIPYWSYFGACTGTLVGEVIFTAAGLAVCRRLGVTGGAWRGLAGAALAGAVMAGVLWLCLDLSWPLLIAAVFPASLIYFSLCIFFGALRWAEVVQVFEALTGRRRPAARTANPSAGIGD